MLITDKRRDYKQAVISCAEKYNIPANVVAAVIIQESGGDSFAMRYEPAFYKRYIEGKQLQGHVPRPFPTDITERHLRSFSFGLMQIMGQTAREFGYNKRYLTELLNPADNIELGCKILRAYIDRRGSIPGGLLRYNGGGDIQYPDKVLARIDKNEVKIILG